MSDIRIAVVMSGGVDSSAAALLLCRRGFMVEGVTLLLCEQASPEDKEPSDARAVCEKLGIPHHTIDLRSEFEQYVTAPFCREYQCGRTPNPCIECNKHIKFGKMLDWSLEHGFDAIATGHYARIKKDACGEFVLYRAKSAKDQSYVLWRLNQRQLSHIVLPLSGMDKQALREEVRQAELPVFAKKDSQDICFVPDGDYAGYIHSKYNNETDKYYDTPGAFVTTDGMQIGWHKGMIHYTVGQRKGLGGGFSQPMFVLGLRPKRNEVVLGTAEQAFRSILKCRGTNLIQPDKTPNIFTCEVKIRYAATEARATVALEGEGCATVRLEEPQRAPAPGQSVVFYDRDRVIGGGIIDSSE